MGRIPLVASSCSWWRSAICRALLFGRSTGGPLSETERGCLIRFDQLFFHLIAGAKMKLLRGLIVFVDDAAIGSGKLNRPGYDSVQHRLEIKSGADCLTNFSQRFQFSNRPRKLLGPRLEFLEQAHVLDGDHRLIGEGFQ